MRKVFAKLLTKYHDEDALRSPYYQTVILTYLENALNALNALGLVFNISRTRTTFQQV